LGLLLLGFLSTTVVLNVFDRTTLFSNNLFRSKVLMMSVGIDGASGSNPPWIYTLFSMIQLECLKRCTAKNLYHSEDSVS